MITDPLTIKLYSMQPDITTTGQIIVYVVLILFWGIVGFYALKNETKLKAH